MYAPLGVYRNAMRRGGLAGPASPDARTVEGIIASRSGSATAVPMPRNTVRREIAVVISRLRGGAFSVYLVQRPSRPHHEPDCGTFAVFSTATRRTPGCGGPRKAVSP